MKFISLILFTILFAIIACEKKDDSVFTTLVGKNGITYNDSKAKWTQLKKKNGNSYVYQTILSSWTGHEG